MKMKLFAILMVLFLLIAPVAEANDWTIGLKNSTGSKMKFTMTIETSSGVRHTLSPREQPIEHGQNFLFKSPGDVGLMGNKAKIEIQGILATPAKVRGKLLPREWGNLGKSKYLEAKIQKDKNKIYINIQ